MKLRQIMKQVEKFNELAEKFETGKYLEANLDDIYDHYDITYKGMTKYIKQNLIKECYDILTKSDEWIELTPRKYELTYTLFKGTEVEIKCTSTVKINECNCIDNYE